MSFGIDRKSHEVHSRTMPKLGPNMKSNNIDLYLQFNTLGILIKLNIMNA